MPKIDMPIGVGNKDYSDEAKKLTELMFDAGRTSKGQVEYTSATSGISYRTADYPDNSSIYNKGDVGLISLLHTLYGGEDGWIMMAKDINEKSAVEIVKW